MPHQRLRGLHILIVLSELGLESVPEHMPPDMLGYHGRFANGLHLLRPLGKSRIPIGTLIALWQMGRGCE